MIRFFCERSRGRMAMRLCAFETSKSVVETLALSSEVREAAGNSFGSYQCGIGSWPLGVDEMGRKMFKEKRARDRTLKITVQFSRSVVSDSLRPHEPQYTRPPSPSPTPGVYPNSCPLSQWCHTAISSSVIPFSSCPQSFPASGSFQMSQLFAAGGQSIGVSASTSDLPMNTQDWSPLGWTGWIALLSKGLSRVFSNTTVQKHQFFCAQLSLLSNSHIVMYGYEGHRNQGKLEEED